jgi:protein N-lysine methyltransferase METTL21C
MDFFEYSSKADERCLSNMFKCSSDSSDSESEGHESEEIDQKDGALTLPPVSTSYTPIFIANSASPIEIETNKILGIAHQLWPASLLLCNFFSTSTELRGSSDRTVVIELGAGVGLGGIYMGSLGYKNVIITDLSEAMELIEKNIERNRSLFTDSVSVQSRVLCWGNTDDHELMTSYLNSHHQDCNLLLIAADCVYWEHLYEPFFNTLYYFITTHNAKVVLAHFKRWKKEKKFFALCSKYLNVQIVYEDISKTPMVDQQMDCCVGDREGGDNDNRGRSGTTGERRQISRVYYMSRKVVAPEES